MIDQEDDSLVVIGGGIAGLSTAIAWALTHDSEKRRVTVFERHSVVGGCVASFKREGYLFDTSQIIPDCRDVLAYLGVSLEMKRFQGDYCKIFKIDPRTNRTTVLGIPSGFEAFEDYLESRFPPERENIRRFIAYSRGIYRELFGLKLDPNLFRLLLTALTCPKLMKFKDAAFAGYLDHFNLSDPDLREILGIFAVFGGLSAERVAALMPVGAMNAMMEGSFRPAGAFLRLPHAMRKRLEALGGSVRTRTPVGKILVAGNRVRGVKLVNGEIVPARWVVSTADPKVLLRDLVGRETFARISPAYVKKLDAVRMSVSSVTVSLGLDDAFDLSSLGLGTGYNVITTGGDTFELLLRDFDRGIFRLDPERFHLAVISPSLTAGGRPTLVLRIVPAAPEEWIRLRETDPEAYRLKKEETADFYIGLAERHLVPGLRTAVRVKDIATPATFARYLGSPTGSNYDMAPYPDNYGRKRLPLKTPVEGLLVTKFSHGIWPSLQAGLQAADFMCGGKIMQGNARFQPKQT